MDFVLQDLVHGNLLGDASIGVYLDKYYYFKVVAKDKNYLYWQSHLFEKCGIKTGVFIDNKVSRVHRISFYINSTRNNLLLGLHDKWYEKRNGRNIKIVPVHMKLNPTVLLLWYLGDGSLVRGKENRTPRIVLATNCFSKRHVKALIKKLKEFQLNFYSNRSVSGFNKGKECGSVLISHTEDGTPFRFFKLIGFECPKEIADCTTGNKGRGSRKHYFRDKWPSEEDWIRILSNLNGIGKIVRKKRIEDNLSQKKLGELVGSSKRHIRHIEFEDRFPSVTLFKRFLNTLKIDTFDILKEVTEEYGIRPDKAGWKEAGGIGRDM